MFALLASIVTLRMPRCSHLAWNKVDVTLACRGFSFEMMVAISRRDFRLFVGGRFEMLRVCASLSVTRSCRVDGSSSFRSDPVPSSTGSKYQTLPSYQSTIKIIVEMKENHDYRYSR
jgi:hypothetical protein